LPTRPFSLSQRDGPRVTLTADTGAVAHIFVAEEDIFRVLLLTQGKVTSAPSWAVAPGQSDIDEPGRDRMSVEGFAAPDFSIDETETHISIATARLRVAIARDGSLHMASNGRWHMAIDGAGPPDASL
jgi:alpha-glucosidase